MKSTDQIIEEIRQIKDQYESQVTGKHKQWPRAIKERVIALTEAGVRSRLIADRTGISYHTVISWNQSPKKNSFRELAVVDTSKKVATATKKSVTVTVGKKASAVTDTKKVVTVKTPDGFLIHAHSVAEVLLIIRGCRLRGG